MTAPSRAAHETRKQATLVRYSASEFDIVKQRARECGRPVARYIREASLGAAPRARRSVTNDTLIRRLGQVATHLSRLRDIARERQLDEASDFQATAAELLNVIRQIE